MHEIEQASPLWPLPSGTWRQAADDSGFAPVRTPLGFSVVPDFFPQQWRMCNAYASADPQTLFPPEFNFHPASGARLQQHAPRPAPYAWVAPYGAATLPRAVLGLPQTQRNLALPQATQRQALDDPDHRLPPPPAGDYEFFSLPCETHSAVLLALDSSKGLLYGYWAGRNAWRAFNAEGLMLGECRALPHAAWRCHVAPLSAQAHHLFLPTDDGLVCLTPSMPALAYRAQLVAPGRVVGAPLCWGEQVWALLEQAGQLHILCCSPEGELLHTLPCPQAPGDFVASATPLANARHLLWLGEKGQVRVRKHGDGQVQVQWQDWPEALQPQFEFGTPYLAADGDWWQLCQSQQTSRYVYLNLLSAQHSTEEAEVPRLCIGSTNYRYAQPQKNAPWEEPEHGDDRAQTQVFVPLLEAPDQRQVLGVQLDKAGQGLAEVLRSKERQRATLTLDQRGFIPFGQIAVNTPTQLRFFSHNHYLWVFHPQLSHIQGWELEP